MVVNCLQHSVKHLEAENSTRSLDLNIPQPFPHAHHICSDSFTSPSISDPLTPQIPSAHPNPAFSAPLPILPNPTFSKRSEEEILVGGEIIDIRLVYSVVW
jgi:hypothetical protein